MENDHKMDRHQLSFQRCSPVMLEIVQLRCGTFHASVPNVVYVLRRTEMMLVCVASHMNRKSLMLHLYKLRLGVGMLIESEIDGKKN